VIGSSQRTIWTRCSLDPEQQWGPQLILQVRVYRLASLLREGYQLNTRLTSYLLRRVPTELVNTNLGGVESVLVSARSINRRVPRMRKSRDESERLKLTCHVTCDVRNMLARKEMEGTDRCG
jgi:hypothetical protein